MLLEEARRRRLAAVELRDVAVALPVVVVRVEHDLAGERLGGDVAVRGERNGDDHDLAGGGDLGCRGGASGRAELVDEAREGLGTAGVRDHDLVAESGEGPRELGADVSCADDSDGCHALPNPVDAVGIPSSAAICLGVSHG